jgi:hypothetical protein
MLSFDRLIRSSMTIREVRRQYPETQPVFEEFGFRPPCDDCSIELVARRQGLPSFEIVDALNVAIVERR